MPADEAGFSVEEAAGLSDKVAKTLEALGSEVAADDQGWTVSKYVELAMEIGRLVQQKQIAYGDSYGKSGAVMRILYPDGIQPDQYDDALGVVRTVDKLFRIATDRDALGESPWGDISGYGILGVARVKGL